jgi:CDP-glucose 4,6-dehydratase
VTPAAPRREAWSGKRVFVTGHTGFVGGWLSFWLSSLGARVSGFALPPPTEPSFHDLCRLPRRLERVTVGDVRDADAVAKALRVAAPQVVVHLAAQPLVRAAWRDPAATFATNAMGTVHLLEACRRSEAVECILIFTTDKVYRNDEAGRRFEEGDALGGSEPYGASKVAAEWAVAAYRESYFRNARAPAVATVRAGNILGGGDWAADRLLPDAVRAFSRSVALRIRNPDAERPWQHVLDAVRGTLLLGEHLSSIGQVEAGNSGGMAWNLGPQVSNSFSVVRVADMAARIWGEGASWVHEPDPVARESRHLALSSERAASALGWKAAWSMERSVTKSIEWYRAALSGEDMEGFTERQIREYFTTLT